MAQNDPRSRNPWHRALTALASAQPAESLALFRIAVGAILTWEAYRFLARGWVTRYWIEPELNFTYTLFSWLRPLPGDAMIWLFYALVALGVLLTLGLFQRAAALLFTLGFGYAFLLEESRYLNHLYLMNLVTLLLVFVPASRVWSIDALLGRRERTAPAWALWLVRFQIGVPYFYGGIAKINPDWLRGEPIRLWLSRHTDFPLVGPLFTQEWVVAVFAYGGLLIDLVAVPLLLWRRTRPWIYLALLLFHMMNSRLFNIGIFPWVMMIATTIFFEADWPSRLVRDLRTRPGQAWPAVVLGAGLALGLALWLGEVTSPVPLLAATLSGAACGWTFLGRRTAASGAAPEEDLAHPTPGASALSRIGLVLIIGWVATQSLLPLRHFLLPGRSSWTEEGHRFAWHMMLRTKSGGVTLRITDPATRQVTTVEADDVLPDWQAHQVAEAPHMIHQFALHTAERFASIGFPDVEVRAIASISLNGRAPQLLIDPAVDLAALPRSLAPARYIVPLETPLVVDER
jgi:hypothetical protein